jgi:hypothetical protein
VWPSRGEPEGGWKAIDNQLKELLSEQEYAAARRSTQYAHYTSPEVIEGIWHAMETMGFKGGRVLEPGAGVGHFWGLMPEAVRAKSSYVGIERDNITAQIASLLYPEQTVHEEDYRETRLPDGYFDIAIGNPPFKSGALRGVEKKYQGAALHDYFIRKTIDKVRPGGLVALVTSRYTMDKATDGERQKIADEAQFLGAVRLPQTAFKQNAGTDVVTDILFFVKKPHGQSLALQEFIETEQQQYEGPNGPGTAPAEAQRRRWRAARRPARYPIERGAAMAMNGAGASASGAPEGTARAPRRGPAPTARGSPDPWGGAEVRRLCSASFRPQQRCRSSESPGIRVVAAP